MQPWAIAIENTLVTAAVLYFNSVYLSATTGLILLGAHMAFQYGMLYWNTPAPEPITPKYSFGFGVKTKAANINPKYSFGYGVNTGGI
jgi:hypothetical protein